MTTELPLLPTTIVGSLPQPDWLIDRARLSEISPPRLRMRDLWRVEEPWLEDAQDDATLLAIDLQARLGLDVLTDGEMRRESYANRFSNALDGLDIDHPGTAPSRTGRPNPVPRVIGPITRGRPVQVRDVQLLRANTDHAIKITVPGPFTMAHQLQDEHYHDVEALAMALAAAVNAEVRDLEAAGADVVQIDEPLLQAWPDEARAYGVKAIDRALQGAEGTTALHTCFGYGHIVADRPEGYPFLEELADSQVQQLSIEAAQLKLDLELLRRLPDKTIMLGVIDIVDPGIETAEAVAGRVRRALLVIPPSRLVLATDCGMKYLSRDVAQGKLQALVAGTGMVRNELTGTHGSARPIPNLNP
jgi:5-methyltetrahydropteroyltriglutamate--homocysteine methyltransferase